jgi:hypothetical protein
MAFLSPTQAVRTATVVAVGEITFLEVNLAAFELASEECKGHFQSLLINALIRRLRSANAKVIEHAPLARIPIPEQADLGLVLEAGLDPIAGYDAIPWTGRPIGAAGGQAGTAKPGDLPEGFISAANSTFGDASRTLVLPRRLDASTTGPENPSRSGEGS